MRILAAGIRTTACYIRLVGNGHVFMVYRLGGWPPPVRTTIVQGPVNDGQLFIEGDRFGRLRVYFVEDEVVVFDKTSRPVLVRGQGYLLLEVSWQGRVSTIRINGKDLGELADGQAPVSVDASERPLGPPAYADPAVEEVCRAAREQRAGLAQRRTSDTPYLREKDEAEQLQELRDAITALTDLIDLVESGRGHLLGPIAVELRGLIYFDGGRKYNPLLLRIAGEHGLSLPVYYLGDEDAPKELKDANYHFDSTAVSVHKSLPMHQLIDLQDWLNKTIQTERFLAEFAALGLPTDHELTTRDMILQFASTDAGAHYHKYAYRQLDKLKQIKSVDTPLLAQCLLQVARIVADLGWYCLRHAGFESDETQGSR